MKMLLYLLLALLASCGRCSDIDQYHNHIVSEKNVAEAINEFGYKLLVTMMERNGDRNTVISPASVAGLLAMTLLGTVGKTHDELANVLGFSSDVIENRKTHEEFGELLRKLDVNSNSSKTVYADAMFVDTRSRVRDIFATYLARVYKGEVQAIDFTQAEIVKDFINEWVDTHTEGKMVNFLQKPLPTETKAVLLSALYFRGQWKQPFAVNATEKAVFKKPSNESVTVDLMLNTGSFKYIFSEKDNVHIVALPYNDSSTTLYAVMPRVARRLTLRDLLLQLSYSKLAELIDTMETTHCVIRIPKMDLQTNAKLEDPLKALGVHSLFTPGQANFALMMDTNQQPNKTEVEILSRIGERDDDVKNVLEGLPNPGLHVDSVLHDVKLTINEYGTEAVAATSGLLARTVRMFRADRPFYIFIRNENSKLVTFSAVINDPTISY